MEMLSIIIIFTLIFFLVAFIAIYKTRRQANKNWKKAIINTKPDYTKVEHKWASFNSNGLYYCNVIRYFFY